MAIEKRIGKSGIVGADRLRPVPGVITRRRCVFARASSFAF